MDFSRNKLTDHYWVDFPSNKKRLAMNKKAIEKRIDYLMEENQDPYLRTEFKERNEERIRLLETLLDALYE